MRETNLQPPTVPKPSYEISTPAEWDHMETTLVGVPAKPSYEISTLPEDQGPLRKQLTAMYNDYQEARAMSLDDIVRRLDAEIPIVLDVYERTECQRAACPAWRIRTMRAGYHFVRGDLARAIECEHDALRHADESAPPDANPEAIARWKAISASNLSEYYRKLGQHEDAVCWARESCRLWFDNPINHFVLAMALYRNGQHGPAGQILEQLGRHVDFGNERDGLAAVMMYEPELKEMTDLPQVRDLLKAMHEGA